MLQAPGEVHSEASNIDVWILFRVNPLTWPVMKSEIHPSHPERLEIYVSVFLVGKRNVLVLQ